jgi:methionyl-tRNA synthetase
LLRVRPESFDSEFSWSDFAQKCNKEMLNSIGNLFQRVLKYSFKSFGSGILPLAESDLGVEEHQLIAVFAAKYEQYLSVM